MDAETTNEVICGGMKARGTEGASSEKEKQGRLIMFGKRKGVISTGMETQIMKRGRKQIIRS